MTPSIRFDGRVAIVTGAGRGLGRAYALELARRGAKVVVNDPGVRGDGVGADAAPADAVVDDIRAFGGTAIANYADISDAAQASSLVAAALDAFGEVHIVINNAGITRDRTFLKKDLADFHAVINVHVFGTVNVTHAAWPHMIKQNYGRVLMTTSISGTLGSFGQSDYSLAKAGMLGLMKTLALEGARGNVFVNAVSPAAGTRMTEGLISDENFKALHPDRVVPAALFLVSDNAPNGCAIQAGGGAFSRLEFAQSEELYLSEPLTLETFAGAFPDIANRGALIPVRTPPSTK